jgi:tRNA-dihydrouridine synthase A
MPDSVDIPRETARSLYSPGPVFAVAPMLDWTDRNCRLLHRRLSQRALLYTEMVTSAAIRHGDRSRLLDFSAEEHPVALQLGGSDPGELAEAARVGEAWGYDEINLNVGCPSDRVQSGRFGACLMLEPELVAACVAAMKAAVGLPVTVKCRIGVDEQDPEPALDRLADLAIAAGADALWVHARKAWLKGLSPRENRDIPPLDYDRVRRLKTRYPQVFIGINGGITSLAAAKELLCDLDGVMLGRTAYQEPEILARVDREIYGEAGPDADVAAVIEALKPDIAAHLAAGGRLSAFTRHMIGLYHGVPGARAFRRILTEGGVREGAGLEVIDAALAAVRAGNRAVPAEEQTGEQR